MILEPIKAHALKTRSRWKSRPKRDTGVGAAEREAFRRTAEWREFRSEMFEKNPFDALTGMPLRKDGNCHHKISSKNFYKWLDPQLFCMLNKDTHTTLHDVLRIKSLPGSVWAQVQTLLKDYYRPLP